MTASIFDSYFHERNLIKPYLEEYVRRTPWEQFIGNSQDSIIFKKTEPKHKGDTIVFPIQQLFDPTVVYGLGQLTGQGDTITTTYDKIEIDLWHNLVYLQGMEMEELRVDVNLDQMWARQLFDAAARTNKKHLIQRFGLAFTPADPAFLKIKYKYSDLVNNMKACAIDDPAGISSQRVVFGKDRAAGNTVGDSIANAVMTSAVDDALGVNHLRLLKKLAKQGSRPGNANKEAPLRPTKIMNMKGFPMDRFVYVTGLEGGYSIKQDPLWSALAVRPFIESPDQPSMINGADYLGMVDGIHVYEDEEFDEYNIENADGAKINYGVLLGGAAIGYGIYKTPFVDSEAGNINSSLTIAHKEYSGMKVLKYPSKSDLSQKGTNPLKVESGVIHSFTRLS